MAVFHSIPSWILPILFTTVYLVTSTAADQREEQLPLRNDSDALTLASTDYGNLVHQIPYSVLFPRSINDIISLVKSSNSHPKPFGIAARGHGHSIRGQAMGDGGSVVVDMSSLSRNNNGAGIRVFGNSAVGFCADVGGEQLWIDVLKVTLKHGLSPVSWTDYLYLSVGGTLSNAGISGQAFMHGPQISTVLELDVITGKGEFITCSKDKNAELFFGVLGGLGQFGIITRARIVLAQAPTRVKWARLLYSDFSVYTRDQEHLISSGKYVNAPAGAADYVEGHLITNANATDQWRSAFSSPSNHSDIASLLKKQGILYSIEVIKYYDNHTAGDIDEEFETLLKELNFIPNFIFSRDASYFDFLNRIGNEENLPGPSLSHPWLNLFIPKSRISDFNAGVLAAMLPNLTEPSGIFIFYPFNHNKWDYRTSAVIPDEDVFYTLALLHTSRPDNAQIYDNFNNQVVRFCKENGIRVKQYLPHYELKQDWMKHYGPKWKIVEQRKSIFDPKRILSPGQRVFNQPSS